VTRLPFEIRALEGADGALATDLVTQAKTSAERLVLDAVGFAKSTGRSRVLGRALPGDRETKNVFERTGLVSQVIVVGKRID